MFKLLFRHIRRLAIAHPIAPTLAARLAAQDETSIHELLDENASLKRLLSDQDKELAVQARTIQSLNLAIQSDDSFPVEPNAKASQDLRLVLSATQRQLAKERAYRRIIERDEFGRLLFFKDLRPDSKGVSQ